MSGTHTPGPWVVGEGAICGGEYGGTMVCEHPTRKWERLDAASAGAAKVLAKMMPESEANARLIAAAPELLEALRELLAERYALEEPEQFDAAGNWTSDSPASVKARAAIAKATGGEGGAR